MSELKKILAAVIGFGKDIPTIFRVVILIFWFLGGNYTGSSTKVGDAIGILTDKERSLAAAAQLLNETPKPEIVKAVDSQTKSTTAVVETIQNIKPEEPAAPL